MNARNDRVPVLDDFDTTITRALTDAERESLAAAQRAAERNAIPQQQVAPGVWRLTRDKVTS